MPSRVSTAPVQPSPVTLPPHRQVPVAKTNDRSLHRAPPSGPGTGSPLCALVAGRSSLSAAPPDSILAREFPRDASRRGFLEAARPPLSRACHRGTNSLLVGWLRKDLVGIWGK